MIIISNEEIEALTFDQISLIAKCISSVNNVNIAQNAIEAEIKKAINSARVLSKDDIYHRIPFLQVKDILKNGTRIHRIGDIDKNKPYIKYLAPGNVNGKDGIYEISGSVKSNKNILLNNHSFFRPFKENENFDKIINELSKNEKYKIYQPKQEEIEALKFVPDLQINPNINVNQILKSAKQSAIVGASINAISNISQLFDGDFNTYFEGIFKASGHSALNSCASDILKKPLGKASGIVGSTLISTATGLYSLAKTGDARRFGKDLGKNALSTVSGIGGSYIGGAIGTVFGPPGILVGGILGNVIGNICGSFVANKTPGLKGMSKKEIKKLINEIDEKLKKDGVQIDKSISRKELIKLIRKNKIPIVSNVKWTDIANKTFSVDPRTVPYMREQIIGMLKIAKTLSQSDNINEGLIKLNNIIKSTNSKL